MSPPSSKDPIVIIGGGIIGTCCAYFISTNPSYKPSGRRIVLLEASELAGGASGKAGGLLATWAFPSCIVPLSFRLHAELAEKHGGAERWGYRVLDGCWSVDGAAGIGTGKKAPLKAQEGTEWLDGLSGMVVEEMAPKGETAQVHPRLFTRAIAEEASNNGVEIIIGKATKILTSGKQVTGVIYTTSTTSTPITLPASIVILAAGPWTPTIYSTVPISALRAHSVVIRPSQPIPGHAIFTNISLKAPTARKAQTVTPEIYPRPDGTIYACGSGDTEVRLPDTSAAVVVDESRVDTLLEHVHAASEALKDGEVLARQACYLPNVNQKKQGPIIGETSVKGLLIAAGHTCWGIQNSAGTGKVVSEIVWEGKATSADVSDLDPKGWGL